MIKRVIAVSLLASGCFNFQSDLQTCVDAGRCGADAGGPSGDGGNPGSIAGVGTCNAPGECWESPLPTGLSLTGVVNTGPDDWWFSSSRGHAFHLRDGGWSMHRVGTEPRQRMPEDQWLTSVGVVSCAGVPWFAVTYPNYAQYAWGLGGDGGFFEGIRLADRANGNDAVARATWSSGTACAWAGDAFQSTERPWFAEADDGGPPRATWEVPELNGDRVSAIGGTSLDRLWLSINGAREGIYGRGSDGGFALAFPRPVSLSQVNAVCELEDGTVIAGGQEGLATADDDGGQQFFSTKVVAVACIGNTIVGAAQPGLVSCRLGAGCLGEPSSDSINFTALAAQGDQVMAIGTLGEVIQRSPGGQVTLSSERVSTDLEDVWVGSDGGGYAVGNQLLLVRTASGWSTRIAGMSLPNANTVRGLENGRLLLLGANLAVFVEVDGTLTTIKVKDRNGATIASGFPLSINTAAQAPDGTWWAVGTASADRLNALHLVGDTLFEVAIDGGADPTEMHSVTFAPNGEGWAGGRDAKVWHFVPARGWELEWRASEHTETFAAALATRGSVWMAGGHGKIAQYIDGGWQTQPFPDGQDELRMLYDSDAGVQAVGRRHRYLLDSEGDWVIRPPLPIDPEHTLRRGIITGDRGWIVGERGTIVSFPR